MRLAIRKLTYAPEEPAPQPNAEATKEFMMSPGNLRLEASLDKEVQLISIQYYGVYYLEINWGTDQEIVQHFIGCNILKVEDMIC